MEVGRNPVSKHQIKPVYGDEQADARRDCRTRIVIPNSQARTRTEKFSFSGNGQKRELPVLFGQKRIYPENSSGRECCWPYLIGQHPLSPVFGQKRPGTPGNSYFAQLPPVFRHFCFVFGHFMFLSGGLLDYSNRSTAKLSYS